MKRKDRFQRIQKVSFTRYLTQTRDTIQLRSPDAMRLGWNVSWVKPWNEAMDFPEM